MLTIVRRIQRHDICQTHSWLMDTHGENDQMGCVDIVLEMLKFIERFQVL